MVRRLDILTAPDSTRDLDAIESWLSVMVKLLPFADSERSAIRDELESHLRERVRDLELEGEETPHAVRIALEELGEAAELATKLKAAHRAGKYRRRIMQAIVFAAILTTGSAAVLTLVPNETPSPVAMYEGGAMESETIAALDTVRLNVKNATTMRELVEAVRDGNDLDVFIDWSTLEHFDIKPETTLGISGENIRLALVLDAIKHPAEDRDARRELGWTIQDETLFIDAQENLDRRTMELMTYPVDEVLSAMIRNYGLEYDDAVERIQKVIFDFTDTDQWKSMGGRTSHLQVVGNVMFVEAPMRIQSQVRWIMSELHAGADRLTTRAGSRARAQAPPSPGGGTGWAGGGGGGLPGRATSGRPNASVGSGAGRAPAPDPSSAPSSAGQDKNPL